MKFIMCAIANMALFGFSAAYFGLSVCIPMAAVYCVGIFQSME